MNFSNVENNQEDGNTVITVDAKNMTGLDKIGSKFSDADLVIENLTTLTDAGAIRNTSDLTITMHHTDNFNSDEDASDLTVYFDEADLQFRVATEEDLPVIQALGIPEETDLAGAASCDGWRKGGNPSSRSRAGIW